MRRFAAAVLVVALIAAVLVRNRLSDDGLAASADLTDVGELAVGAAVQFADLPVGQVQDIGLVRVDGRTLARVHFVVERDAPLPERVEVRVRRTTVLGEKVIELRSPSTPAGGAVLRDGAHLGEGVVLAEVEQLVESGGDVMAAIGTGHLGTILDEGAKGLADQGPVLRQLLDDLGAVASSYGARSDALRRLVVDLEALASDAGPAAEAQAELLGNLADLTRVLAEERGRLVSTASAVAQLAEVGAGVLQRQVASIESFLFGLHELTRLLAEEHEALGQLLTEIPRHNAAIEEVVIDGFIQLLIDVTLCGIPGGGEVESDPARVCDGRYVPNPPSGRG